MLFLRSNRGEFLTQKLWIRPPLATLVLFTIILVSALFVWGWFAQVGVIKEIIWQLQTLQKYPPAWLRVPMVTGEFLLFPTIALSLIALAITYISPQPQRWSRFVIVAILLILTLRYIIWRSLTTLNLVDPLQGSISISLFVLELFVLVHGSLQLLLLVQARDRSGEADAKAEAVIKGEFCPSVDVLIPTYNEPEFILKRTVIACQAMDYPNKKIYLLDDTRRPHIKALAEELGCEYMTRPDNRHAKAGNLNHGIARTKGELIVCFDADFVPTKNFLIRTVVFFQDEQVALVQTPQSYYNPDPIARNLGLENIIVPEQEVFYRQIQPVRDGTESVVCAGTSFVVRRSALEAIGGGFVTSSLSEDYFTAVRLSHKGYKLIYLDEKLSAGSAPDDMGAHATQRFRWAQGTLQAFFIEENPLTIRGLKPIQRLAHLTGIMHWFTCIPRVGFLLVPLAYSFLDVIPVQATIEEVIFYFLPFYVVNLLVFSWLSNHTRSVIISDIYDVVLCIPLSLTVLRTLVNPFGRGFKVTPKGTQSDRLHFNWQLALPLMILFVLTAVSLWLNLGKCVMQMDSYRTGVEATRGLALGWWWSAYNLLLLGTGILVMLDAPKPDAYEWFYLRRVARLQVGEQTFWGITSVISEIGAGILLTQSGMPSVEQENFLPVEVELMEEQIKLSAVITKTDLEQEFPYVRVSFTDLSLNQQRQLVELLFCRPGQWKRQNTPNELMSLLILFKHLLVPQALLGWRKPEPRAIAIGQ
ncbi:MAG: glycosyltransferase [Pseudanabaenaceae cyanobacterium]